MCVGIFFKYAVKSDSLHIQYHVNGMDLVFINDKVLPSKCLLVHSDSSLLDEAKVFRKMHRPLILRCQQIYVVLI